jgi:hypothetical protein
VKGKRSAGAIVIVHQPTTVPKNVEGENFEATVDLLIHLPLPL